MTRLSLEQLLLVRPSFSQVPLTQTARQALAVGALMLCLPALYLSNAAACECVSAGSACGSVQRADAVFIGRVTGLSGGVQFEVERSVVGASVESITVGNGPGNCALSFTVGSRFVVYAYRDRAGMLVTGMCTRTRPLSDPHTRADIAYFDRRERNATGGLLTGVVSDATVDLSSTLSTVRPLVGIRISVAAEAAPNSPVRTTITRDDGSYELEGLPPDRVRVTASLPARFASPQPITVVADASGCAEADIAGRIDGRIRGHLLDEGGRPARAISVQLADAAAARAGTIPLRTISTVTDEEGTFEFRQVNVGRYVIGVELDRPVREGKLNRRRFYPNAASLDAAADVNLDAAEHVVLPAFRLAPLPSTRVITVVLRTPSLETADATELFLTGSTREPISHRGASIIVTLPFGAQFTIEARVPTGYTVMQPSIMRIDRDDLDRLVEFRIER
jgi:hypothetical protein